MSAPLMFSIYIQTNKLGQEPFYKMLQCKLLKKHIFSKNNFSRKLELQNP